MFALTSEIAQVFGFRPPEDFRVQLFSVGNAQIHVEGAQTDAM